MEVGDIQFAKPDEDYLLNSVKATMTPETARELDNFIAQAPPGASPDAYLAAFRAGGVPDSDTTDAVVAGVDGAVAPKPEATEQLDDTDGFWDEAYEGLKGVTRTALNTVAFLGEVSKGGYEAVVGASTGRNFMGADREDGGHQWNDVLETTSLWQQIGHWSEQGSGFFNGEAAGEAQEKAREKILWREIESWVNPETGASYRSQDDIPANQRDKFVKRTRIAASSLGAEAAVASGFGEGTAPFKVVAGVTDFMSAVALDPLTLATLGAGATAHAGALGRAAGVGVLNKRGRAVRSGFNEQVAEATARTRDRALADAAQEVLDMEADTRRHTMTELKARQAAVQAKRDVADSPLLEAEAERVATQLSVAHLSEIADEAAKATEKIRADLDEQLAGIFRDATEGSLGVNEQVEAIRAAVSKATESRIAAVDAATAKRGDILVDLQNRHRDAVKLFDGVLRPGVENLGDDVTSLIDDLRAGLKPMPGAATRQAEKAAADMTSTPEIRAAASRRVSHLAGVEARRAKDAEQAADQATKSFSLLESSAELARRTGDTAALKAAEAAKHRLTQQVRMLMWPAKDADDQAGRIRKLNEINNGIMGKWGGEAAEKAAKHADDLGESVKRTQLEMDIDSTPVGAAKVAATKQQILDEAAQSIDDMAKRAEADLSEINDVTTEGWDAARAAGEAKIAAVDEAARAKMAASSENIRVFLENWKGTLQRTREAREADAAAALREAEEASAAAKAAADANLPKLELLRTVFGLHDEVEKLLGGNAAPLRQVMNEAMGRGSFDAVDWEKFQKAMLGKHGDVTIAAMIAETSPYALYNAMGRKVHMRVAKELAKATTRDEVLDVLSRAAGARVGIEGPLTGFGMRAFRYNVPRETERFYHGVTGQKAAEVAFRAYSASGRIVPWAHEMHLEDVDSVAKAFDDWLNMAIGNRARRTIGREQTRTMIAEIIDDVVNAEGMLDRRLAIHRGLTKAADKMAETNSMDDQFRKALGRAFDEAFKVLPDGTPVTPTSKGNYITTASTLDPAGTAKSINGIRVLDETKPQHLYQLSETFRLPDVKEIQKIIRQGRKLTGGKKKFDNSPGKVSDLVQDFLEYKVDRIFRTAVLVWRPAFIIRNIGEAGFRQFLNGSLHDPFTLAAMTLRHSKKTKNRGGKWLNWTDGYTHDVLGRDFRDYEDITTHLSKADADMAGAMWRTHSVMDPGFERRLFTHGGGEAIEKGHPEYAKAWHRQLTALRGDKVTTDVVSVVTGRPTARIREYAESIGTDNFREATIRYYSTGPGKAVFERMAAERPEHWGQMLDAAGRADKDEIIKAMNTGRWRIDEAALEQVLFTHQGSFSNRAKVMLGNFDERLLNKWLFSGASDESWKVVKQMAKEGGDSLPGRVWYGGKNMARSGADEGLVQQGVSKFFHWSAITEGAVNWAPETRWAYWNRVDELFEYMTKAEQEAILKTAEKSLSPIRIGGKAVGLNKQTRLYKRLQSTANNPKAGRLTKDEVHGLASQHAARESAELFYDGFKRKQYWYATRLLFPFGQAWGNTLATWARLATRPKGAVRVVAVKKAIDAFDGGYAHDTREEWEAKKREILNDPRQRPLLYRHPQSGEMVFDVPLVGGLMGKLPGIFGGGMLPTADTSMSLASMNVGIQNGGAPGFGPAVTIPAKLMYNMTDVENLTPAWVDKLIEPFPSGAQKDASDIFYESLTGTWMRRVAAAFLPQFGQQELESMLAPATTYLVTARGDDYFNEAGWIDSEASNRLAEDAARMARGISLYRGLSQAALPGTAIYQWLTEADDGTTSTQAAAALDFNLMMERNGNDFATAVNEFEDTYGQGSYFNIVGKYKGGFVASTKAAAYFKDHQEDLTNHPDVAGLFFPYDGTYSPQFDADLRIRDLKERKSVDELIEEANRSRYFYIVANLAEKVANGEMSTEDAEAEKDRLSEEFGVSYTGGLRGNREAELHAIARAVEGNLGSTEAGQAAKLYLAEREAAMADIKASGVAKSFGDKDVAELAAWMHQFGTELVAQYPDFERMWQQVFESEVAG